MQSLRGMNDLVFSQADKFLKFIFVASQICQRYGFSFIRTPILEESGLFTRTIGESSDIVAKEMYRFIDKGGNDVCMRPEGTAGVVRAFIEKKFDKTGQKYKFFYYGSMYRYERPQKGRLREFFQFGVESFGEDSVYEDATIICLASDILKELGIDYKIKLNSVACPSCMPSYKKLLLSYVNNFKEKVCDDCLRRLKFNPLRVIDCKNETCNVLYKDLPKIVDYLCDSCDTSFKKLLDILSDNEISFEINHKLVRGLDYYTKTAFEFISLDIGAQDALIGGGRYDNLVQSLGGKSTYGIGFAVGIDRLLDLISLKENKIYGYYFGVLKEEYLKLVFKLSREVIDKSRVYIEYKPKNLTKHLSFASKNNFRYCIVIGEDEFDRGSLWVKDLETSKEFDLNIRDFKGFL